MPNYENLTENLTRRGYTVRRFPTARQAADYLDSVIDQTSVAFGGSVTLDQLDLYPRLSAHNRCLWHWKGDDRMDGMQTEVYLSSVNGLAETGELINIDGAGNRVASTLFGHKRVYFVVGANKIAPDYDAGDAVEPGNGKAHIGGHVHPHGAGGGLGHGDHGAQVGGGEPAGAGPQVLKKWDGGKAPAHGEQAGLGKLKKQAQQDHLPSPPFSFCSKPRMRRQA